MRYIDQLIELVDSIDAAQADYFYVQWTGRSGNSFQTLVAGAHLSDFLTDVADGGYITGIHKAV